MKRQSLAAEAVACANIALAKYWGKRPYGRTDNLPAVPSISMTLDRLRTVTHVRIEPARRATLRVRLDGVEADETTYRRVGRMVREVLRVAGLPTTSAVWVDSHNDFPTASGLASSASGFAALAAALRVAAGLPHDPVEVSRLARRASASAARSVWGGFVELPAGDRRTGDRLAARPLVGPRHWDLRMVVAIVGRGPKAVGSREAMERTRRQSPLYAAWLRLAPRLAREVREGLMRRDLERVGRAMERSTLAFHATALLADPPILYAEPATIELLRSVWRLREEGRSVWATMDAGPHVKALCAPEDASVVAETLRAVRGVRDVLTCKPGPNLVVRRVDR
ncbi:MAG: diphosphomevalonate decarboxylase [Myxococcota bacterium]|nr:diphosphomevalonate decarboxylase [Myxococcota bacterium]MDW8361764.1 diphosphomevalonate decarboxylase [Myxococcales bacterium]